MCKCVDQDSDIHALGRGDTDASSSRRSAKLFSQLASVSRSQPSASPALLGHGLVPRVPNVGVD